MICPHCGIPYGDSKSSKSKHRQRYRCELPKEKAGNPRSATPEQLKENKAKRNANRYKKTVTNLPEESKDCTSEYREDSADLAEAST